MSYTGDCRSWKVRRLYRVRVGEGNCAKWRIADGSLIRVVGESGWLRHHATFNDFILKADFKTAAGPIALQAHDPTTNLDFKNIKVRSLR